MVGVRDFPALHGGNVLRKLSAGAADRRARSVLPYSRATQLDFQRKVPRTPRCEYPSCIHALLKCFMALCIFSEEFSNCWLNFSWKTKITLHTQVQRNRSECGCLFLTMCIFMLCDCNSFSFVQDCHSKISTSDVERRSW